jgi:hypothetical protein
VVNDEARGGPDAAWSQPFSVSVASQYEDVHVLSGGHDLAFDTPTAALQRRGATKPRSGFGEQLVGCTLGDLPQCVGSSGRMCVSSEQAPARPLGDGFRLGAYDVQECDIRISR